ncbi:hypothetical protein [Mycolicibacterium mucogenicum]|uniref:Uncharacterized protein n=1 Tax=Mycolicibacterium mucogenicum DSM 44124 TaxID=1226753 RepID=A0A8E4W2D0_MYCMU|nr:hypothetical protein [Mycolicibacterium mucogenicum]KAB7752897.1 hypothetical protein MMUC44124_26615 [Mycolicibacterium mucogenicum DSM 44124]QPG69113.1 hypothetical protein C1S78_027630 [Mycolicibacterium mucogenicum DSM 44124]
MTTAAEQNARYLAEPRQCVDCGGTPDAGRLRCTDCHAEWMASQGITRPFVIEIVDWSQ